MILTDGDTIHAAASEPVVRRSAPRREPPPSPWAQIDLSGTLVDATPAGRCAKSSGARSSRRCSEAENDKGRAAELLQISYKMLLIEAEGARHRVGCAALRTPVSSPSPRSPICRSACVSSSVVTSSTIVVAPIAGRQHEVQACRRPPSCRGAIASSDLGGGQVGDRRQRPELGDQRRQRLAVALGERAARHARARRRRACRRRPLRRGGSGGTSSPLRARGRRCGRS